MDIVTLAIAKKMIAKSTALTAADSIDDLPKEGNPNSLYKVGSALYEWNGESYVPFIIPTTDTIDYGEV